MEIISSKLDQSVNFVLDRPIGKLECRYVRRQGKNIIYVSSQSGCKQACRMCHLTAQGLTNLQNATEDDFVEQVETVWQHIIDNKLEQERLHINFMARGEPLANPHVYDNWPQLATRMHNVTKTPIKNTKFILSTIFPKEFPIFELIRFSSGFLTPRLYWSAYSTNHAFRKQWLPRACDFHEGIFMLSHWWRHTHMPSRIHFALIDGQNDSVDDTLNMIEYINQLNFPVSVNLVRYNPFSISHGSESASYDTILNLFKSGLNNGDVKIIERVGLDSFASCGMFIPNNP